MATGWSADLLGFAPVEGRAVVAGFDGGTITSEAGGVLLGAADRAIGLVARFARCFSDSRSAALVEHTVSRLVGQRVFAIAPGEEDAVDHDALRHDPILAVSAGKPTARGQNGARLAGKSTLNRRELGGAAVTPDHKIGQDPAAIERVFVDLFVEAHRRAPQRIILDLDATDDRRHG